MKLKNDQLRNSSENPYFIGTNNSCVDRCPTNYYANPIDKKCVSSTNCPTTPVTYYAFDPTNMCL